MHPLMGCTRAHGPRLFAAALALVAAITFVPVSQAGELPPPVCEITPSPAAPAPNQAFELCGPSGAGYTYSWYDDAQNLLTHDRCVQFPNGLPAGSYDFEFVISQGPDFKKCPYTIVIEETPDQPTCDITITPEGDICSDKTFTMCGPDHAGFTYSWLDKNDVLITHDRCLTQGPLPAGTYDYTLVISNGPKFVKCPVQVEVKDCEEHLNCPRTIGFWGAQCDQKDNGSTKFNLTDLGKITHEVDNLSTFFNWGSGNTAAFCAIMNPPTPMTQAAQAKRQYAGMLANIATGNLDLTANNGNKIFLDVDTPISCTGLNATTIGGLIPVIDALLADLEGDPLTDEVKAAYGKIIDCTDAINNGIGIGTVCREEEDEKDQASRLSQGGGAVELYRATPNPFTTWTRVSYAVKDGGEVVDIGVYDVAGRLVRSLASGYQNAGSYDVRWDGTNASGVRMKSGVFFVRGRIGESRIQGRLLLLK
jgi:hypothetical protein